MTVSSVYVTGGTAKARSLLDWQPRSREDALIAGAEALIRLQNSGR